MKEFTIEQVKDILGVTYPTAHNIAREKGRFDAEHKPNGKWFVPCTAVYGVIRAELQAARAKELRYDAALLSDNGN